MISTPQDTKANEEKEFAPAQVALLQTAETLFAAHGIQGVSLREIAAQAGAKNVAAVQYHFKDRSRLVTALFEYRMRAIDAERRELLDAALAVNPTPSINTLIQVMVQPLAALLGPGASDRQNQYLRFLLRFITEPLHLERRDRFRALTYQEARDRIAQQINYVPMQVLEMRFQLVWLQLVHALAERQRQLANRKARHKDTPLFVGTLTDAMQATITAPLSDSTRQLLETQ